MAKLPERIPIGKQLNQQRNEWRKIDTVLWSAESCNVDGDAVLKPATAYAPALPVIGTNRYEHNVENLNAYSSGHSALCYFVSSHFGDIDADHLFTSEEKTNEPQVD